MKKSILFFIIAIVSVMSCFGQKTTFYGGWTTEDYQGKRYRVASVEIDRPNNKTYVVVEVEATQYVREIKPSICTPRIVGKYWRSSDKGDNGDYAGFIADNDVRGDNSGDGNQYYDVVWKRVGAGTIHWYKLIFNVAIPYGETEIRIENSSPWCSDKGFDRLGFNCTINNPMVDLPNIGMDEDGIKEMIEQQQDPITGIYEDIDYYGLKLACIKHEGVYKLIFLSGGIIEGWNSGEIKATLKATSIDGIYKASWYDDHKLLIENVTIGFDEQSMVVSTPTEKTPYNRVYPALQCNILKKRPFDINNLGIHDLDIVMKYFKENMALLDPIEGIYNLSISRTAWYRSFGNINESYSYKCVIIRYRDGFVLKRIKQEDNTGGGVYDAGIHQIGETNVYDIKIDYGTGDYKRTESSRMELSSLLRIQFKTSINFSMPESHNYNDDFDLIKEYPTPAMYEESIVGVDNGNNQKMWTGTGFALGNGYIVTNNHVADKAKNITVKGVKGDMNAGYIAEVVATDKVNDIAILRINDSNFNGFGTIPYSVQARMADVGEDVFVLGYPLTQALGNEIKLTNGIVSSRTGYQGDISTYQISAPIQPGNSGGPMFDRNGNIIGIVVAGVPGAENVGYAIKTSYLRLLIESVELNVEFPNNNTISTLSLAEKVKRVKDFVLYIECGK